MFLIFYMNYHSVQSIKIKSIWKVSLMIMKVVSYLQTLTQWKIHKEHSAFADGG